MYVVWKMRELRWGRPCERCGQHGSHRRSALIPLLVESRRVDGSPRQIHVARLPSIRTCCIRNPQTREQWWGEVDRALDAVRRAGKGLRLTELEARTIRRKLQERIAGPRTGQRKGSGQHGGRSAQPRPPGYLAHALRVLGLGWPCGANDVKSAFRTRAKQSHPDTGGRAEEFREVYEAHRTLLSAVSGPLR